jgi:undecaprenyl-diphosphatase
MEIGERRLAAPAKRLALFAAVALFVAMALLARERPYFDWDLSLAGSIQAITFPGFRTLMVWISALGNGWLAVVVVGAGGLILLAAGLKKEALICVAGAGAGAALNRGLKALIARPRPEDGLVQVIAEYYHESFPSGHTVMFVEFFGFLMLVAYASTRPRRFRLGLTLLCAIMIALIGISRVHLGAHWPSDVTGGYLLGGITLALMVMIHRRWNEKGNPGE